MSSAREPDPPDHDGNQPLHEADGLSRLALEMRNVLRLAQSRGEGRAGLGRRRKKERAELEYLKREISRWSTELDQLREEPGNSDELERLKRELRQRDSELRALRGSAAGRELDLQKEHDAELRSEREKVRELERRLAAAESGHRRDEELREVKRDAQERERKLRQAHAERLSALQAQRHADNQTLIKNNAGERARLEEELKSLRLRRDSEARSYGDRLEELATQSARDRASLEESVAKLREKHEAERSRLQERIASLQEALQEQERITLDLLEEMSYVRADREESSGSASELRWALSELRGPAEPNNRLADGLALFNETEHLNVVGAICKSLGEPEVHAAVEHHGGSLESPVITFVWPGMGWRRYVCEPEESAAEPRVYLAGDGEDPAQTTLDGSPPNARLDAEGRLALGVRPL